MQQQTSLSSQLDVKSCEALIISHVHRLLSAPSLQDSIELPPELSHIDKMVEVHSMLLGLRNLVYALSRGDLEHVCRERGFIVGALKALQSNLRHMTWQIEQVACGEYRHRVDFLGDFSAAFNQMAEKLGHTIHSLKSQSEEYEGLSHRDPLTELYNRHAFIKFSEMLLRGIDTSHSATLIFADIDHFKKINDTYGHPAGDEVLRVFAKKLLSICRSHDLCCRYGGEEFLLLMPETPIEDGLFISERMRKSIASMLIPLEDREISITVSFGLCEVNVMGVCGSFESYIMNCIRTADSNMYKAKISGRNCVVA